jgi:hypothetical protein
MKITAHNYEEHALDYIEGTLAAERRAEFERFLEANPSIARRIAARREDMPVAVPDASVVFEGKAGLKKPAVLKGAFSGNASVRVVLYRMSAAAAVLLIAALGYTRLREGTEEFSTTPAATALVEGTMEKTVEPTIESTLETAIEPAAGPTPGAAAKKRPAKTVVAKADIRPGPDPMPVEPIETLEIPGHPLELAVTMNAPALSADGLARESRVQIVAVSESYVAETPGPADESTGHDRGFLNLLSVRGMKQLISGIIAPLSEISPISIHENNHERVVEIASIPVSRRPNQTAEN